MADFVFSRTTDDTLPTRFQTFYDTTFRPLKNLTIGGNEGTFAHVEEDDGFISVVGHVYSPGQSLQQTLSETLRTFDETRIAELKRALVGQYTLLIKKQNVLYMFSDCLQVRSIFYSPDAAIVSSSFTAIEDALDTTSADLDPYKVFDVYWMEDEGDDELFYEMTEGFASTNNAAMTPLFKRTDAYDLGTGGCFGTELFYPLAHRTVEGFIEGGIGQARRVFDVDDAMWERFRQSLVEEFEAVKRHYAFAVSDEADLVRMLWMLNVGWFASFLSSMHGIKGRQIEPYGSMAVVELAFKVPESRLGSKKHLGRTNLTQKFALREVNPTMANVMTRHHCPMTPLTAGSFVPHLSGYLSHVVGAAGRKISKPPATPLRTTRFPGGTYVSNGWNVGFMRRVRERYGDVEMA